MSELVSRRGLRCALCYVCELLVHATHNHCASCQADTSYISPEPDVIHQHLSRADICPAFFYCHSFLTLEALYNEEPNQTC